MGSHRQKLSKISCRRLCHGNGEKSIRPRSCKLEGSQNAGWRMNNFLFSSGCLMTRSESGVSVRSEIRSEWRGVGTLCGLRLSSCVILKQSELFLSCFKIPRAPKCTTSTARAWLIREFFKNSLPLDKKRHRTQDAPAAGTTHNSVGELPTAALESAVSGNYMHQPVAKDRGHRGQHRTGSQEARQEDPDWGRWRKRQTSIRRLRLWPAPLQALRLLLFWFLFFFFFLLQTQEGLF